jgi:hypothetical protein
VSVLEPLGWLAGLDLVYWGDIDTHGFTILDRLRRLFPHARSMLMDRGTLLAHRTQWVTEPNPSAGPLNLLDAEEAQLSTITWWPMRWDLRCGSNKNASASPRSSRRRSTANSAAPRI